MILFQGIIPFSLQLILAIVVIIFVMFLNRKIKKSDISVKSIVVWYVISLAAIIIVVFPGIIEGLQKLTGIATTTSMLLFTGVTVMAFLLVYQSVKLEMLEQKNRQLAQDSGILRKRIEDLENKRG